MIRFFREYGEPPILQQTVANCRDPLSVYEMSSSKIEWTETTWDPLTGCTKISPGCKNCYAERMARRLQAMNSANYANGFTLTCHPHALDIPFSWKKERMVFVNSMSDLFHEAVPEAFIKRVSIP